MHSGTAELPQEELSDQLYELGFMGDRNLGGCQIGLLVLL